MVSGNILNVKDDILFDENIIRYDYHTIQPYASSTLDNDDEIRLPIHQQDVLTLPSESYLLINGKLNLGENKTTIPKNEGLDNNAMAFLFSEIRFELNSVEIDRVRNPGITSLLKGLASFTEGEKMQNSSWRVEDASNSKEFNYCVPLKMLMGFAEDYKKVLINSKQELVLVRSRTDDAAILDKTANGLKITLSAVQWLVPFVTLNDAPRLQLLKLLDKDQEIRMAFRSWQLYEYPQLPTSSAISWPVRLASPIERPRYAIVGFQTNRQDVKKESNYFDNCKIRSLRMFIGNESYPYVPIQTDFPKNQTAILYELFRNFPKHYYGSQLHPSVNRSDFDSKYPIWVIDCSRQKEMTGSVDIRLEIDAQENFPVGTSAYCLIVSDSLYGYSPFSGTVRPITK